MVAIASAMILAAARSGTAEAPRRELAESEPALLESLSRKVPAVLPRAWRWVAEMEEIAAFAGDDPAARTLYRGAAELYDGIARDVTGDGEANDELRRFFADTDERR